MAVELANALLRFVAEDENLLVFLLRQDGAAHGGAGNGRRTDLHALAFAGEDHMIKSHFRANFALNEIASENIAFGDAVLLAARLDNRVHNLGTLPYGLLPCQTPNDGWGKIGA